MIEGVNIYLDLLSHNYYSVFDYAHSVFDYAGLCASTHAFFARAVCQVST